MHWEQALRNLRQLKADLQKITANEMEQDALENIRKGVDVKGRPFTPRKANARRNTGRSILVYTGRGRRSLRGKPQGFLVKLEGEDYMVAHNEGVNRTVSARSRRGKTFSRKMNLPQRQLAGDSLKLRVRVANVIGKRIIKALT